MPVSAVVTLRPPCQPAMLRVTLVADSGRSSEPLLVRLCITALLGAFVCCGGRIGSVDADAQDRSEIDAGCQLDSSSFGSSEAILAARCILPLPVGAALWQIESENPVAADGTSSLWRLHYTDSTSGTTYYGHVGSSVSGFAVDPMVKEGVAPACAAEVTGEVSSRFIVPDALARLYELGVSPTAKMKMRFRETGDCDQFSTAWIALWVKNDENGLWWKAHYTPNGQLLGICGPCADPTDKQCLDCIAASSDD